ncbi:MAG: S-layer homology domain-containing protein [Ruminococcaceae bacterium]|nr:S-layer homology domain-containing protein [Oscillospiraceae bacterium]
MKKILTLILALSILFSMSIMPQAIADTKDEIATDFSAELLYTLGIVDEEIKDILLSDENITRAQFAQAVFEVAKLTGGADGEFNDVKKGSKFSDAIFAVSQSKFMKGDGNGNFNPDLFITDLDAMITILRVLGYEEYSYYNGGYPNGYYMSVRSTKLLDGIKGGITNVNITGKKLAILLKNMIDEHVCQITKISADGSYEKELSAKPFVEIYYNIGKAEGIVTGNTRTTLTSKKETGGIIIEGRLFSAGDIYCDDFIGINCYAYYNVDDNSLIYMNKNDRNIITIIPAGDIVDVRGSSIIYEVSETKNDTITFPANANIIYNGAHLSHYSESVILNMASGEVKLIDNNCDRTIDVVSILSYETCIIDRVNSKDEVITFKYGAGTVSKDDMKNVPILDETGKTDMTWLHEWDALDILRDDEGNITAIYAKGKVERKAAAMILKESDGDYIMFDDGTTSPIQKHAKDRFKNLELNTKCAFSFDMFGNVAAYTIDELSTICVIVAVGEAGQPEPDLYLKYYNENEGLTQTVLKGNIRINGVLKKTTVADDYVYIKNTLSGLKGELVEIDINDSGRVAQINVMEKVYDPGSSVHVYLNRTTCAVVPSADIQYFVKKTAKAYYVPKDLTGITEDDFTVRDATAIGETDIAVVLYKKFGSQDKDIDAVKVVRSGGGVSSMGSYDNPMLVSKKTEFYNEEDGMVYTKLIYWHGGVEKTALVEDASAVASIDEGDVAWIDIEDGKVMGLTKYFDYSVNGTFPPENSTPKSFTASKKLNRGYIKNAYDEFYEFAIPLEIAGKDENGQDTIIKSEKIELHRYPSYGYVFESSKSQKVRKATPADFVGYDQDNVNYSKIFVHSSYTNDYTAVIYK